MKFAIANAGWLPDRRESLAMLMSQLSGTIKIFTSRRREHASVWAPRLWQYVADQADPVVCLNDDIHVCPDFERACDAVAEAAPERLVSLHTQVPGAAKLVVEHWCSSYWLTGPAYMMWPGVAAELLDFWASLPWRHASQMNEDNCAIHWAWSKQQPILQTIPALAHHDVGVPSSLGYDNHPFRTPSVPFGDEPVTAPGYWTLQAEVPYVENPWATVSGLEGFRRSLTAEGVTCDGCSSQSAFMTIGGTSLCSQCAGSVAQAVASEWKRRIV
jgi:hypothetical protein